MKNVFSRSFVGFSALFVLLAGMMQPVYLNGQNDKPCNHENCNHDVGGGMSDAALAQMLMGGLGGGMMPGMGGGGQGSQVVDLMSPRELTGKKAWDFLELELLTTPWYAKAFLTTVGGAVGFVAGLTTANFVGNSGVFKDLVRDYFGSRGAGNVFPTPAHNDRVNNYIQGLGNDGLGVVVPDNIYFFAYPYERLPQDPQHPQQWQQQIRPAAQNFNLSGDQQVALSRFIGRPNGLGLRGVSRVTLSQAPTNWQESLVRHSLQAFFVFLGTVGVWYLVKWGSEAICYGYSIIRFLHDWPSINKAKTPKELHAFFDREHANYVKGGWGYVLTNASRISKTAQAAVTFARQKLDLLDTITLAEALAEDVQEEQDVAQGEQDVVQDAQDTPDAIEEPEVFEPEEEALPVDDSQQAE